MEPTPLYYRPGKKISNSQFFRNYWCRAYDQCLNQAALEDLFLDCKQCSHRNDVIETFSPFVKGRKTD